MVIFAKNQISANFMYIERNPNIKFPQNIADTKWISEPYPIFSFSVKPQARKIRLYENKKGESKGSDSPL